MGTNDWKDTMDARRAGQRPGFYSPDTPVESRTPYVDTDAQAFFQQEVGQSGSYAPLVVGAETFTYNADGTVATEVISGITFTYAYNADGSVHTITRSDGPVLTFSYNGDGTVAAVA